MTLKSSEIGEGNKMDYQVLLAKALLEITRLESGTIFEVKDLFPPHEWKKLTHGNKIGFGQHFSREYKEGRIPGIEKLERGKDNHSRYIKR